jgi:hypothetical protein
MRLSLRLGVALCLAGLLSGCVTTQELLTKVNNLAVAVFKNLSVGTYKATPEQIRLADERATAEFNRFSPQEKEAFEESDPRYLAVRTVDPTPAQWTEIRRDMQKPGSLYGGPKKTSGKVYCVMMGHPIPRGRRHRLLRGVQASNARHRRTLRYVYSPIRGQLLDRDEEKRGITIGGELQLKPSPPRTIAS